MSMNPGRRLLITRHAAGALALAAVAARTVRAQERYPDRPVHLVIPFPPGGPTDIFGRLVAGRLGDALGQQIVVDNRPGAAGIIASEFVAKAKPDGYTLLFGTAATVAWTLANGASIVRVHDVEPMAQVVKMISAIRGE